MINFNIHNVTEVQKARVSKSDYDSGGWIVLDIGAQNYAWDDEDQPTIKNEVTFFFKDLELGLAQLRTEIEKGIASFRSEEAELAAAKAADEMMSAHREMQKIIDAGDANG